MCLPLSCVFFCFLQLSHVTPSAEPATGAESISRRAFLVRDRENGRSYATGTRTLVRLLVRHSLYDLPAHRGRKHGDAKTRELQLRRLCIINPFYDAFYKELLLISCVGLDIGRQNYKIIDDMDKLVERLVLNNRRLRNLILVNFAPTDKMRAIVPNGVEMRCCPGWHPCQFELHLY